MVLAVVAYNRWAERKLRRQLEERFSSSHEDVLLDERPEPRDRVEPVLEGAAFPADERQPEPGMETDSEAEVEVHDRLERPVEAENDYQRLSPEAAAVPEPLPHESAPPQATISGQETFHAPDPDTEYVATLNVDEAVATHALLQVLRQIKPPAKPSRWLGWRGEDVWDDLYQAAPDNSYLRFAACLQLADRGGPVQSGELSAFCGMVQTVAATLYAVVDCPDKHAALAAAQDLDQFCADVDVLIGVNVVAKEGAFAGTKIRGLAEASGMKLMPDGNFHYLDEHHSPLFALSNLEAKPFAAEEMKYLSSHGLTFVFDVPKAAGGVRAFNHMLLVARKMAASLNGLLVDDNRRELSEEGVEKIRQQLLALYRRMEESGVVPGGERALRLFA